MSMHLVGPYMTPTNYKKRKQKRITDNQHKKLEQEWKAYNKRMRQAHCHNQQFNTLEEYISYTQGNYVANTRKNNTWRDLQPQDNVNYRSSRHIPSAGNGIGNAEAKERKIYSGERQLLGIATMHKSNMVPVFADNKEQAVEIAQMRRN